MMDSCIYEDDGLLGYCVVKSSRSLPTFTEVLTASINRAMSDDGGSKHL
jgi:hypothetical protein